VNQPIATIRLFEFLLSYGNEYTLFIWFCFTDLLALYVQFLIVGIAWRGKKQVKDYEIAVVMLMMFFSPL
jgi:hypothetical protein